MEKFTRSPRVKLFFAQMLTRLFVPDYKKVWRLYRQAAMSREDSETEETEESPKYKTGRST